MGIYIDYETVCVNCKTKGYNFGYSFKTIKYEGIDVLDLPNRYLNGSMITFNFYTLPILIHCQENAHQNSEVANKPVFSMINAKKGESGMISKFTYVYMPQNNPDFHTLKLNSENPSPKLMLYVDTYQYKDKPYFFTFYTFRNRSKTPLSNFKFYQFFDFDIYGQDNYDTDMATYDPKTEIVYQFDAEKGLKDGIIAGIGSVKETPPSHFEVNMPDQILTTLDRRTLRDKGQCGPGDCSVALEWDHEEVYPDQLICFPIFMAFGKGQAEFEKNCKDAREHLAHILPTIYNAVNGKFRQLVDPKLEEMSFNVREWCKD